MKNASYANFTLSPVRRAAAFFAFLGFLTLSSCEEKEESSSDLMKEQTRVFHEMTALVNQVADGGDQKAAAKELTALGNELKELKVRLAAIDHTEEKNREKVLDLSEFSEATAAYQAAQEKLFRSGRNTQELARALIAHHNPAPMTGEGNSQ